MRAFWTWGQLLILVFVLGCSSQEGNAQDRPAEPVAPAQAKPTDDAPPETPASKPKAGKKKEEADTRSYTATVRDRHLKSGEKPFVVDGAVLFVPEVTLFGGGAGDEVKVIELKRGSALIKIPFVRIARLEVGKHKEDRLDLTIKLRGAEAPNDSLTGTVKSSLELRGALRGSALDTVVKLREARTIDLALTEGN